MFVAPQGLKSVLSSRRCEHLGVSAAPRTSVYKLNIYHKFVKVKNKASFCQLIRHCGSCNVVTSVLWCHEFQTRMECYVTIYGHSTTSGKHVSFRVTRQFCVWSRTVMYVYCFLLI